MEPIREIRDIQSIKKLLGYNPRNFCLFVLGSYFNLRASDLLRISAGQVRDLQTGDEFSLKENKTGKERRITLNKSAAKAIQDLLDTQNIADDHPFFFQPAWKNPYHALGESAGQVLVQGHQPQRQLRQPHPT